MVRALHPPGRFACRLDRGEQQPDHHADDRDHDKKLDEREAA
jgi:hypothetical protein